MPANLGGHFSSEYFYGGKIMSVFETIKAAVTLRQAAEHYGLRVLPNGMTCCPFHKDRHPSLKLNEDYFFCFGCGAVGDVVDFTASLFGLSCYEAAQKLAQDFGISPEPGQVTTGASKSKPPQWHQYRLDELRFLRVLTDYLHLLKEWKYKYAPQTPEDILDDRFVASCQQYDRIAYLLDFLAHASVEERDSTIAALLADGSIASWENCLAEDRKGERHRAKETEIA